MNRALNRAAIGELLQLLAADEEGGAWRGERQDNKGYADVRPDLVDAHCGEGDALGNGDGIHVFEPSPVSEYGRHGYR